MPFGDSPQPNLQFGATRFSARFWFVIVLTGAFSGLAGALLMRLLREVERMAWPPYRLHPDFLTAVRQVSADRRLVVLGLAALLAGLVRRLLSHRKAPRHAGDVVESIWLGSGRIPFFRTLVNSALSITVVGMGAALGREGGIKNTGAALASLFSVWQRLPPRQRRLVVACGAGAGMAAAYNVPFGGALYAMEVLLGSLALPDVVPALLASLVGTACSWVLLPNAPVYPMQVYHATAADIAWALAAGPLLGLAAAWYIRAIAWADSVRHDGWRAVAAPMAALLCLGLISVPFPEVLGNGKDVVQGAFGDQFSLGLLLLLPFVRCAATTGCLAAGIPGGLFTPTLTCGATLSVLTARLLSWVPGLETPSCAVIGGGAFLAAATEGPVSAIVLLLELTRHIQGLMVPLMLAVTGASLTARALEVRSIYSARIRVGTGGVTRRQPVS